MITKKLLKNLVNAPILEYNLDSSEDYLLYYTHPSYPKSINIYKLAIMAKKWALENYNIEICSSIYFDDNNCIYGFAKIENILQKEVKLGKYIQIPTFETTIEYENKYFESNTEIEAIFKACNYILDSIKN